MREREENKEIFHNSFQLHIQSEGILRVAKPNIQIVLAGSSRSYQTFNARDASSLHPHTEESHLSGQDSKKRNKRLERNKIEASGLLLQKPIWRLLVQPLLPPLLPELEPYNSLPCDSP